MSKEYTLADFTDIFDYSTGWFSDSSICSLFYQIFKRFPSMKMVKYKVNQDFLKEIKKLYQQDDAFADHLCLVPLCKLVTDCRIQQYTCSDQKKSRYD